MNIQGLHHAAFRCRDSAATRAFYEDFLGLPLVTTLRIRATKTGRPTDTLHTFFRLGDGSCLAFFESPDLPFDFKAQHDFDLHIALAVDRPTLQVMLARGRDTGVETRGIADHGSFDSIYLRDPDGYVIELACRKEGRADAEQAQACVTARSELDRWLHDRAAAAAK